MITAFDADVLIYAASNDQPLGRPVADLFDVPDGTYAGVGSVLLLVEVLSKPMRAGAESPETIRLMHFLSRLDLCACDQFTARMALALAAKYGLRSMDATHLATAIVAGADRFLTDNRKDFSKSIHEIEIVYPDELIVDAESA